jgi:WD40 repeat protein
MIDRCARALAALAGVLWASSAPADEGPVSFRRQVAPLLVTHCLGCHSAEDAQGGLSLETFATLKLGGAIEGEAILEPGEPAASHLVAVLKPTAEPRMPMKAEPLSDAQIALIETWVSEGAKFDAPSEETRIEALVDPLAGVAPLAPSVSVSDPVSAVAYSTDGRLAAARGETVHLFGPSATLDDHPGPVNFLAFAPGGKSLVAAGGKAGLSGFAVLWDLEKNSKIAESAVLADAVLAGALSPDGKTLATAGYDRLVRLWDVASMTESRVLKEHTDAVYAVAFSPGGETLASASGDRTVKTWYPATGKRLASIGDATAELYAVAFSPDGRGLLAAGADKRIWSWRLEGEAGRLEASPPAHEAAVLRLAVAPSGDRLVSTSEDRGVKVWALPVVLPIATLPVQPDWPMAMAFEPGGRDLAVGRARRDSGPSPSIASRSARIPVRGWLISCSCRPARTIS